MMKKLLPALLLSLVLVPAEQAPAVAADAAVISSDVPVAPRYRARRVVRHHYVGCPDGYSCYPLYGAYGPYGGHAYWTAYTGSYAAAYTRPYPVVRSLY